MRPTSVRTHADEYRRAVQMEAPASAAPRPAAKGPTMDNAIQPG